MPNFNYVAMDSRGKETKGTLPANNQGEAINRLKEMGYFPTKVTEAEKPKEKGADKKAPPIKKPAGAKGKGSRKPLNIPGFGSGIPPKVLTAFTRQLATLVDAGLPLLRGLKVLEKQEKNPALRNILNSLALSIESGSTFSEGLAQHPKTFNRLFVNMVKAGELGGVLEVVLQRLSEFMEKAQKIKGKVVAAMFYPVAILVVAVTILTVLMVFVVPKFKLIFADMLEGKPLPDFTNFVLGISELMASHFIESCLVLVGAFIGIKLFITKTKVGIRLWDKLQLNMPGVGPVLRKVAIGRFTRTLGTLVSSGVPILQALTIVKETAGNVIIGDAVSSVYASVKEGETITAPLEASRVFPPMVISMVDVGEQTGALPEMLMKIADNYDEEVDNAVSAMTSLIEPVMIVFLAVIVGSIVIALFLPLISLIDQLGQEGGGGGGKDE